ncbi:hypothetical protein H2248_008437 [Termitomyces sp. 'cryptogamus']|nr:hypothetical protein H2248_008437 [Termitomyces sp. 'cryptogamus']
MCMTLSTRWQKLHSHFWAEPMMLTRRHIAQLVLRKPLFTSRSILTSISRPVCIAFPKPGVPGARTKRLFTTNNNIIPAKFGPIINPDEYEKLLAHACKCWPPAPSVPPNWSCTWSEWEALLSYYWFSPYYLMLPQIELHVNIQYGIRGETRPILFSNERDAFVFTIVDSNRYFLFDGQFSALYCIKGVSNDHQLVELMIEGDDALVARFEAIEESEEGLSAMQRILARDETVIPLLAEKFLHYTPVPTTPRMERNAPDSSPEQDAQFAEYMSRWQEESRLRDEERDSDEIQKLDEEIERLRSILNDSLSENQSRETEEVRKLRLARDADVEDDMQWVRKEVAKFAEVTEVATEDDIPPEELEILKRDTNALKKKIDEIIDELEDLPVKKHQVEGLIDMIATIQHHRDRLDELSLTDSHAMALYMACKLEKKLDAIKENPAILD